MPRPTPGTLVPACVVLALIASVPPVSLAGALAAAAGTLFEALPFVVGAALLPRVRLLKFLPSLACGCGGVLPAALALPALALTWISFGPVVSVARAAAALIVLFVRLRRSSAPRLEAAVERDPLAELTTLALASGLASLVAELIRAHVVLAHGLVGAAASLSLGAVIGIIAPCATSGLAAAIALRAADPWAAFGLLATSGIFSLHTLRLAAPQVRDARFAFALLGFVCLIVWARGTHGFLNPRFGLVLPSGALLASIAAIRRTPTRSSVSFAAPAMVLSALVLGSPPPLDSTATVPVDLYPGRSVAFTGRIARSDSSTTTLVRSALLCCRADAQQLSLTLDRRLAAKPGMWVDVRGVAVARNRSLVLRVDSIRVVTPPEDPYLYL
jgi:uncharacterized protein DUF1980